MSELPREGTSQEIGRLAGRAIGTKFPKAWIEKELDGDTDFGIDYIIQLKSSNSEVSASFYLQLKGTTDPNYSADGDFISYSFKVKTLKYYNRQEPAVMVAVVDLKGNEDELWNCPIYYFWLEDSWFFENRDKLESQDNISVKIPRSNLLTPSLDIFNYYEQRINEKLKVAELKREIQPHSQNVVKSLEDITNIISNKPILLKAAEKQGDEPWLVNPNGENSTKLESCSRYLNANQLDSADAILSELNNSFDNLTPHEKAEYLYQKASLLSLRTNFNEATEFFEKSLSYSSKDRYNVAFLESKFKLSQVPNEEELIQIANSLNDDDYGSAMVKCKCLSLIGKVDQALDILKSKHPNKIIGQLIVHTIAENHEELDQIIENTSEDFLVKHHDKYTFHAISARRAYVKATTGDLCGKIIPIQGKINFDVYFLKKALFHLDKAWTFAQKVGYPSDISILLDISSLIYGYFNKVNDLFYHFEEILKQRPYSTDLLKYYAMLTFNEGLYDKTISLIECKNAEYDANDYGLLVLSYYQLNRPRKSLDYLIEGESKLLEEKPNNISLLFCIGSDLAKRQMDDALFDKYIDLIKGFRDGESFLALNSFFYNSNQNPDLREQYRDELYEHYLRLNNPLEIAEQLFFYLNPNDSKHAIRICELADRILLSHDLFEKDYFRLAQAYITSNQYESALAIACKHIDREVYDPYWAIIQTVCYYNLGRLGLAHDVIKTAIQETPFSLENNQYYANICLQLGLIDDIENALFDILNASNEREQKIRILINLISILSSKPNNSKKTNSAIRELGRLVNQDDMDEEGRFLMFFLTSLKTEDELEIADFQERLKCYTNKFPDSTILKQGSLDLEGDADRIIESIHKMAGITEEQVAKWEQNKQRIRNGSLPVPFVMLDSFLGDTRDVFNSWILSLNEGSGKLEFKINHAPQLDVKTFETELTSSRTAIIEDTALIALHELQLLDLFLEKITEFCLLESTFERITKNSRTIMGSSSVELAKGILSSINKFNSKMVLFYEKEEDNIIDSYAAAIKKYDAVLITEDFNILKMINFSNKNKVLSANIFNSIEVLYSQSSITLEDKFSLILKASSLGFLVPNMTIGLLSETLAYYYKKSNDNEYLEKEFKVIFDKIFSTHRATEEALQIFLKMIFYAVNNYNVNFRSTSMLDLLKKFLLRHPYKDLESFVAFFFVYMAASFPLKIDSEIIPTSKIHVFFWNLYQDMRFSISDSDVRLEDIVLDVVRQLFLLNENARLLACENIKCCFLPMTETSSLFEKCYQDISLNHRIFNF